MNPIDAFFLTFAILGILTFIIPIVFAIIIYLAFRRLPTQTQNTLLLLMFAIGIVLIISLIGIEIGVILELTTMLILVIRALKGRSEEE